MSREICFLIINCGEFCHVQCCYIGTMLHLWKRVINPNLNQLKIWLKISKEISFEGGGGVCMQIAQTQLKTLYTYNIIL